MSSDQTSPKPAPVLNWLNKTFTDLDMQAAYEDAKASVQRRNRLTGAEREADKQATLRWLDTPMADPDMEQMRLDALVHLNVHYAGKPSRKNMALLNRLRGWVGI